MADLGTFVWRGQSGQEYRYSIYRIGTTFDVVPGNYIFADESRPGFSLPIYIGQSSDLSERFDKHHAMPCIRSNKAAFIHVHRNDGGEQARRDEEADLIARWDPPCNQAG